MAYTYAQKGWDYKGILAVKSEGRGFWQWNQKGGDSDSEIRREGILAVKSEGRGFWQWNQKGWDSDSEIRREGILTVKLEGRGFWQWNQKGRHSGSEIRREGILTVNVEICQNSWACPREGFPLDSHWLVHNTESIISDTVQKMLTQNTITPTYAGVYLN